MRSINWFLMVVALVSFSGLLSQVRAEEEDIALDKLPKAVVEAVKKRFPKGEMTEASKETEDGKTSFEVSVKENGKKIDVTLTPEGVILLLEKEIAAKDLPKAVTEALDKKYPKATFKIVEVVIKVKDGKESVDFYETLLETADKKQVEVQIGADGKIKAEEKKEDKDKE